MRELREPVSRTSIIEKRIKRKLEAKYGLILDEPTASRIASQELSLLRKRNLSVERAQLKLLRMKEAAKLRQKIRKAHMKDCALNNVSTRKTSAEQNSESSILEVEY
ncbi:MAG: hypothetical protein K6T73_06260 [Candidatus Bathyarchaeota archaeon]|nr:hypothetical protein [Candidatus Bathyarchaeota archaeon]